MKFITANQFLMADKKVIDAVIEWWGPSVGDLVESTVEGEVWCLVDDIQVKRVLDLKDDSFVIPLLTLNQLIDFIEDNSSGIKSMWFGFNMWNIDLLSKNVVSSDNDLLQALWRIIQDEMFVKG